MVSPFSSTLAQKHKRRRLKSLAFIPTLLTLGNLICGFAAIYFALRAMFELGAGINDSEFQTLKSVLMERIMPSTLSIGAGLVLLGMFFDCFDGMVARVTRSTTNFGGQLDSLADVITCGAAPATLMVAFMYRELAQEAILPSPVSEHFLGRITWLAAAVYVALAAVRLARYNVEHDKADFDHRTFRGLPSPGAAGLMAALILFHEQARPLTAGVIVYCMPVAALASAFLMVSRIPYRRFYRAYLLGRQPFDRFLIFMAVFAVFWLYKAPTLLVLIVWYWASGPVEWIIRLLRGRKSGGTGSASGQSMAERKQTA